LFELLIIEGIERKDSGWEIDKGNDKDWIDCNGNSFSGQRLFSNHQ